MKQLWTHLAAFVAGAVVYQISLILFFGSVNVGPEEGAVTVTSESFRNNSPEICSYLESKGCSCNVEITTDKSCSADLESKMEDLILESIMENNDSKPSPDRPERNPG